METKTIYAALLAIQQELKVPKSEKGYGYNYRTSDGIMQAAKPLLRDNGVMCMLSDDVMQVGNRYYVKSTAKLIDIATGDSVEATGVAVEPDKLASMAPPQITGTASTYARKRALEGLFLLDNEKDIDEVQSNIARQNAQNGAGHTQSANHNTSTNSPIKDATREFNEKIKALNLPSEKVKELCRQHYGTTNFRELTAGQIKNFTHHLEEWAS